MYDTHVEQNFTCIANFVKLAKGIVELIVVITAEGRYPSFDFLRTTLC